MSDLGYELLWMDACVSGVHFVRDSEVESREPDYYLYVARREAGVDEAEKETETETEVGLWKVL